MGQQIEPNVGRSGADYEHAERHRRDRRPPRPYAAAHPDAPSPPPARPDGPTLRSERLLTVTAQWPHGDQRWFFAFGGLVWVDPERRLERVDPVRRVERVHLVDRLRGLDPVHRLGRLAGLRAVGRLDREYRLGAIRLLPLVDAGLARERTGRSRSAAPPDPLGVVRHHEG